MRIAVLLLCSIVLPPTIFPATARAGGPDPVLATARALFQHAEVEYALTHWQEALADYEKAYEAKPLPAFLFNIGQCHRQLKNWGKAAYFYRIFLDRQPTAKNRALVESLLQEVEEEQARAARIDAAAAAAAAAAVPVNPAAEQPPLHRRWYLWAAIGGAVLAGTAVALAVGLGTQRDTYLSGSLGTVDAR